jgi:hypothetical protein
MYWSGIDPMTKKQLYVAKEWKDRKIQQAMLQPHKPGHREILQKYRIEKHRQEIAGGVKKDYGTNDSRSAAAPRKRSIVEAPKRKMGPKLFLDTR